MKSLILFLAVSIFSMSSYAGDGSSGCGPGWFVLKKNSLLSSALRATTNMILMPTVTIGMTLGTSGCTKHSIVKKEKENLKFATENYFEIASEGSKGNGVFITAYGDMMGCRGSSLTLFKAQLKGNLPLMFSADKIDPKELVKQTYIMILKNKVLSKSCFSA